MQPIKQYLDCGGHIEFEFDYQEDYLENIIPTNDYWFDYDLMPTELYKQCWSIGKYNESHGRSYSLESF